MKSGSKKPRRRIAGEKRRVNLKLEEDLAEWAFEFADRSNTTVTYLITDFLQELRRIQTERTSKDAEQI